MTLTTKTSSPASTDHGAAGLTVAGGWALLAISALHAIVLGFTEWWDEWLAGPFRDDSELPMDAVAQFWAEPGSFVVPGVLLSALLIRMGRRGAAAPVYVPTALGVWAALCVWIMGPSGFVLLTVPVVLLGLSAARARR